MMTRPFSHRKRVGHDTGPGFERENSRTQQQVHIREEEHSNDGCLREIAFKQIGLDETVGNEPIISNVKEFLGMVPMVLTIWPALFTGIHLLATRNKDHGDDHRNHSEQEDGKK